MTDASLAFAVAAALHAGFQLTVTGLVYPVLAQVPEPAWRDAHDRHSRLILPLVVLVYGALVVTGTWLVVADRSPVGLLAVASAAACIGVTAAAAAPTHGRLAVPDPGLLRRLLRADRVRALLAVLCLGLALLAT